MINEITAINYAQYINGKAVVKVTAPWCGSCKAVQPGYSKLSDEITGVGFFEINADTNSDFVLGLNVKSLPTFLFYKDGVNVGKVVGPNLAGVLAELKKLTDTN